MASGPYTSCSSLDAAATRHALSGNSARREAPVARLLGRGRPAKVAAPVVESVTVDVVHAHVAARRRSHEELMQPSTEVRAAGGATGVGGALSGLCHPLERSDERKVCRVDDGEPGAALRSVQGEQHGPVAEVDGPSTLGSALATGAMPRLCESDSGACLARMRYAEADDGSSGPNPGTRPLRRRSSAPPHPAHLAWAPHAPITFQPSSGHSSPYRSPRFVRADRPVASRHQFPREVVSPCKPRGARPDGCVSSPFTRPLGQAGLLIAEPARWRSPRPARVGIYES